MFKEIESLKNEGLRFLRLKPGDKRPVEQAWAGFGPEPWADFLRSYRKGENVGVILGDVSGHGEFALAVLDVDVKSSEARHAEEAAKALDILKVPKETPRVASGRQNGSMHVYVLVPKGTRKTKLVQAKERLPVYMPSVTPSKKDKENLTEEQITQGFRWRPAWEIDLLANGAQSVLPPSVHPDTKKKYTWLVPFARKNVAVFTIPEQVKQHQEIKGAQTVSRGPITFMDVPLEDLGISKKIIEGIRTGEGVEDRSAFLMKASIAMHGASVPDDVILSVLTNPDYFIASCAADHTKSSDRQVHAQWVEKHTMRKAHAKVRSEREFEVPEDKPISAAEFEQQAEEFTDWREGMRRSSTGYKATIENILLAFEKALGVFIGFNEFTYRNHFLTDLEFLKAKGQELNDTHTLHIRVWLERDMGFDPLSNEAVHNALIYWGSLHSFDPLKDYVKGLVWDGTPRLSTWLEDYAGAVGPKEYLEAVSRKILMAMVARAVEPGVKFDHCLVLEGRQGTGKSSLAAALAGGYFTDTDISPNDKDSVIKMQGKWIIEIGELSAFTKADIEELKRFITVRTDEARLPYERTSRPFPRRFVMIGTTNRDDYLKDDENRRFWPVKTEGAINHEGLKEVRDQMLAEAYCLYLLGEEPLWLTGEAYEQAKREQVNRRADDPLEVLFNTKVADVWAEVEKGVEGTKGITTMQAWQVLKPLNTNEPQHWELTKLGVLLRNLGLKVTQKRLENNQRIRIYVK